MYFEVFLGARGYQARFRGANHEIVFWSETYSSKQGAIHACRLAQQWAGSARIVDRT